MALGMDIQEEQVLEGTVIKEVQGTEAMVSREAQDTATREVWAMVIRMLPALADMDSRTHRVLEDMVTSQRRGPEGMDHRAGNTFEMGAKWLAVLHLSFKNRGNAFRNPCFNVIKSDLANSQQRT
jgi:hypothetical protein